MIKDKLNGILDKIENNAEGIGGILGIASGPMANGGLTIQGLEWAMDRISRWKIPDPLEVLKLEMSIPAEYPIMNNIMAALGGWGLAEFGSILDPKIAKMGRIVKKAGFAAALGNVIGGFIWLPAVIGNPNGTTSPTASSAIGQYSV